MVLSGGQWVSWLRRLLGAPDTMLGMMLVHSRLLLMLLNLIMYQSGPPGLGKLGLMAI